MRTNYDAKEMLVFFYSNHGNLFSDNEVERQRAEQIVLTKTLDSDYSRYEEHKLIEEIKSALEKNITVSQ